MFSAGAKIRLRDTVTHLHTTKAFRAPQGTGCQSRGILVESGVAATRFRPAGHDTNGIGRMTRWMIGPWNMLAKRDILSLLEALRLCAFGALPEPYSRY